MTTRERLDKLILEHATEQLDVGTTRAAPPPQVWDARAERIARRSIEGVDHDPTPRPPSFDAFIAAMAASNDWGVPTRSSSDPDRFGKGSMGGGGSAMPTNRHDERERYALAERELGRVRDALPPHHTRCGATLTGEAQMAIWQAVRGAGKAVRRIIKGGATPKRGSAKAMAAPTTRVVTVPDRQRRTAGEVAELMAEHGVAMTDHEIGILCRGITRRIRAAFEQKGWVRATRAPNEERAAARGRRGKDDEMPKEYDLEGWKDIAAVVGRSEDQCARLARREHDPLPRTTYLGRVVANRAALLAWCARQVSTTKGAA